MWRDISSSIPTTHHASVLYHLIPASIYSPAFLISGALSRTQQLFPLLHSKHTCPLTHNQSRAMSPKHEQVNPSQLEAGLRSDTPETNDAHVQTEITTPTLQTVLEKHSSNSELVRDAIIGLADGLTVPFALTAGLSSYVLLSYQVRLGIWREIHLVLIDCLEPSRSFHSS